MPVRPVYGRLSTRRQIQARAPQLRQRHSLSLTGIPPGCSFGCDKSVLSRRFSPTSPLPDLGRVRRTHKSAKLPRHGTPSFPQFHRSNWPRRTPRVFTIYSDDHSDNWDPRVQVERQRSFTGPRVIPSSFADKKYTCSQVQDLLDDLNLIMGTSFPLSPHLSYLLSICLHRDYDLGLAYSYLRPHWFSDFTTLAARMKKAESDDAALRKHALDPSEKYITNPRLPPRRVWDLYSNRVIPYYWWGGKLESCLPVSHSWVATNERSNIWTPINRRAWPVPVPNHSTLEHVRIELLNYGQSREWWHGGRKEYSWLDVLCLRQEGEGLDDAKRVEEWKTDVPTIGYIYNHNHYSTAALVYFNGLGRPFHNGGYNDPRHWFNRGWTVQEAVSRPFLGGATASSPVLSPQQHNPKLQEFFHHFNTAFQDRSMSRGSRLFSQYITMMRERHTSTELDRISGLVSISRPTQLPVYDPKQSNEDAWEVSVKAIGGHSRAHLFLWYPVAGNSRYSWMPSWSQVMTEDVPAKNISEDRYVIDYDEMRDEFHGRRFRVLEDCEVHGLHLPSLGKSSENTAVRTGTISVGGCGTLMSHQFKVVAGHQVAIDEEIRYILIFSTNIYSRRFVVGVRNDAGRVKKLCVLDFEHAYSPWLTGRMSTTKDVVLI